MISHPANVPLILLLALTSFVLIRKPAAKL